jgi:diacylglycerol kinase family enzyme
MTVTLQVEGKTVTRRAPLFFVANNKYEAKGLTLGRRERLDSGKLYLYIPHNIGRMHLVKLAFDFISGRIHEAEGIDVLEVEKFTVHARRKRIPVAMDGEVKILESPLEYRSRPRALTVVRPVVAKEEAA